MSAATLPAWADEAGLVGEHNRLRAIAEVQLGQDPADMGLGGLLGDDQGVAEELLQVRQWHRAGIGA